jgi:hypothetical protein
MASKTSTGSGPGSCPNCNPSFHLIHKFRNLDLQSRLRAKTVIGDERQVVSELLSNVDKELSSYDVHIASLQSAILIMQNERAELKRLAYKAKGLLSPIRRLPSEILSEIFGHCGLQATIHRTAKTPAYELGKACTRWKDVINSSAVLWTNISLMIGRSVDAQKQAEFVKRILEKSGTLPLNLSVFGDATDLFEPAQPDYTHAAIEALVSAASRWSSLSIKLPVALTNAAFKDTAGKLPALHEIIFETQNILGAAAETETLSVFKTVETLQRLGLPSHKFTPGWKHKFDFANLLEFTCGIHNTAILKEVARSTNLQVLRLQQCTPPSTPRNQVTYELPIEVLDFHFGTYNFSRQMAGLAWICKYTKLPRLQSLVLSQGPSSTSSVQRETRDSSWVPSVVHLVNDTRCLLTSLTMTGVDIPAGDLLSLLHNLTSLTDLTFHERRESAAVIDENFLKLLTLYVAAPDPDSDTESDTDQPLVALLPKLQRIEVSASGTRFTDKGFVDMVTSRWKGTPGRSLVSLPMVDTSASGSSGSPPNAGAGIRSVTLKVHSREVRASQFHTLKMLEQMGLFVSISGKIGTII